MPRSYRADQVGQHRTVYDRNRKKILATQDCCGICGRPVDKSLKYPHPMSPTVDHIIPINRGGHPSDLSNLQLAHMCCNRQKSDKLQREQLVGGAQVEASVSNRNLPQAMDWASYRPKK